MFGAKREHVLFVLPLAFPNQKTNVFPLELKTINAAHVSPTEVRNSNSEFGRRKTATVFSFYDTYDLIKAFTAHLQVGQIISPFSILHRNEVIF